MASAEELKLFEEIIAKGCCKRCALRYLGSDKALITFDYPNTCLVNFGLLSPMEEFEPPNKTKKSNPCTVCLGLLQDSIIEEMFIHENLAKCSEYLSKTFVAYITFPTCVLVRDHAMKLHLKKMFPEAFDVSKVMKINHAWRYSVENKLSRIIKKTYNHMSKFTLHFYTEYILEKDEMAVVHDRVKDKIKRNSLSRHYVAAFLDSTSDEDFAKLVKVPPRNPLYGVTLNDLKFFSETIHLIGNYWKYSRQLPQRQIFGEAKVTTELNIEKIILNAINNVVGAGNFKEMLFQASSFDDHSYRVLGNGRTFHLQLCDPKFESLSRSDCDQIEKSVSSRILKIKNLREADKRDIAVFMDSEQLSPRSFKVLCIVYESKNIDYCVNAVNMYTTINVYQKTPLRVLNTRPVLDKKKKIYFIKATKVGDNLIELDLCAQCGFYVHEFVHGDLGRTSPSLCDIMRAKVDVLALDVVDFQSTLPCAAEEDEVVI